MSVAIFPVIILLFIGCLAIGTSLIASKKAVNLGRVLILLVIAVATFFVGAFAALFIMFSPLGVNFGFYSVILVAAGVLIVAASACALWGVIKKKCVYIPLGAVLGVCILTVVGFSLYQNYIESIPTVGEGDNVIVEYAPYVRDTKVAELSEESSLKIESDLPRMDGATALFPVYSAFAKAVYPENMIDVKARNEAYINDSAYLKCTTTTQAYKSIVTGEADIIFAAEPSEEQKQYALESGVELVYTPIGKEAFVFFVNSRNPFEDISVEEIRGIYSGEITEWSELGVDGFGKIRAFQREEGSGSQSALIRFMGNKTLMTPPQEDVVQAMGGIIQKASDYKNFKNAIGYSFRFYSTEMVKNDKIKLLSINGVEPTEENIENGTYPVSSYFYAVTRKDASENTKKLVEWILSEQGQELIEKTGYTPVK